MSSRCYYLFEVMSEGIILKWQRILDVAQNMGIVSEDELTRLRWFLSGPWRMYPGWVLDNKITRLHEINGAVKLTLRQQAAAATADGKRAIEAIKQAIEVQRVEEQKAQAAIQRLEAIHTGQAEETNVGLALLCQ
jgi:hypothetical protein